MTSLPALEAEIQAACRAWVASGKRLVRWRDKYAEGGCALDALAEARGTGGTWTSIDEEWSLMLAVGFDGGRFRGMEDTEHHKLGARIAAWAEEEGYL